MSPELDRALARVARAAVLLVGCDFDGTLAPIVADPGAAVPDRLALEPLYRLASLPRTPVLILSGRARNDLERLIGPRPPGIALVGSHGAESGNSRGSDALPDVESFAEQLREVVDLFPGAELEMKPFSVAFHLRHVAERDQQRARKSALRRVAPRAALVQEGKKVVEFMAVPADKGAALEHHRAAHDAARTVFIGDDATDEAAFRVLAEGDVGVKVGRGRTAARYQVAGQSDVAPLLGRLVRYRSDFIRG